MLAASRARILELLPTGALVLDVGGGAKPLPRADWVLDLLDYADRGLYGDAIDPAGERFDADTWVRRDMCDHAPWPFADKQFDFAVCSHTLEDVRDPIWVCAELVRVAKAGYIEVPSRLEEQSYGFQGPWAGWGHHRWLIDLEGDELSFVFKHHVLHNRASDRFPPEFHAGLSDEQRVLQLWWEGSFRFRERAFFDGPTLDAYLQDFVKAHLPVGATGPQPVLRRAVRRLRRLRASA